LKKNDIYKYLNLYRDLYGDNIYLDSNVSEDMPIDKSNKLDEYLNSIKDCLECPLGKTRKNIVLGMGDPNADIVFVGEAPGKQEDLQGLPFVGRSGKLLDKMLSSINLSRDDVYILNVLKCRPPDNRDPSKIEIEKCEPYLKKQLKIIKPKLIVALGRISAMTILRTKESLTNMRNQIFDYEGIDFLVTYHPAALLRNPNFKKYAWEDFKLIRDKYSNV
jgi:DNA polymerase